jgi:uncharacterized protein YkwD
MNKLSLPAAVAVMALSGCLTGNMAFNQPTDAQQQAFVPQCTGDAPNAERLRTLVAASRAVQGKEALTQNALLDRIALYHACDMARTGRADVAGSDGSNVVDRARGVGYPTCGVTQLVAVGGTADGTLATWLGQEAQRAQILGQSDEEIGSGAVRSADGRIWHSVVLGDNCR